MTDRNHPSDEARDENAGLGEQAGEVAGGLGGVLAGAGLGSAAGPIGTIIGGIAGAAGGWWAGEKVGRAADDMGKHEEHYRKHHRAVGSELDYEQAKIGYGVGHVAGRNPEYRGRSFDQVESDLRAGWYGTEHDYDRLRPHVREGYERTSSRTGESDRSVGDPMP